MVREDFTLRDTAIHEAGHALVYLALGLRGVCVSVRANDFASGYAVGGWPDHSDPKPSHRDWLVRTAGGNPVWAGAIQYAGMVAQSLLDGRGMGVDDYATVGGRGDVYQLGILALTADQDAEARRVAETIVRANAALVLDIADVLVRDLWWDSFADPERIDRVAEYQPGLKSNLVVCAHGPIQEGRAGPMQPYEPRRAA